MKHLHSKLGKSDPVSYTCSCPAKDGHGSVLLFYRYWSNTPYLPDEYALNISDLTSLAAWHSTQTEALKLGGKIRVAKEGFNITVGGTSADIATYIQNCVAHWSFSQLDLDTPDAIQRFFKPSPGCACVFGADRLANVRIAAEATPMGVEGYAPADWNCIVSLSPAEFHTKCYEEQSLLLDVRNHYESRIGYFVDPRTGQPAIRPPIRRFSQWPQYVKGHWKELKGAEEQGRQIMTYCTGGIRCEKGVRWMQEQVGQGEKVYTLHGGIAAYLDWMNKEIKEGRKTVRESLFKGKNYVFDARGSMGLDMEVEPVSNCHLCEMPSDRLGKCQSGGCHLVLVVCEACEKTHNPRCCQDCRDIDLATNDKVIPNPAKRPICACEKQREAELWAGERVQEPRTQGWRKQKRTNAVDSKPRIQISIIGGGNFIRGDG